MRDRLPALLRRLYLSPRAPTGAGRRRRGEPTAASGAGEGQRARWGLRWALVGAAVAAGAGLVHLGLLYYVFAGRLTYPLDLEWMEGGMLCHALRALEGKSIYAAPSADFISYLYTPLYPYLLAALGKGFGLSYALGRAVSVIAFSVALIIGFRVVQRQSGGGWAGALWGLAAIGLVAASFQHTGTWYDLVRNDSLYLALISGALFLLCYRHESRAAVFAAGVLAGLAFLSKQTASIFIVASGLALLFSSWRRLPIYVATVAVVAGGSSLLLDRLSGGWYWRYTFRMHQGHDLYWDRIWPVTELKLLSFSPAVAGVIAIWLLVAVSRWIAKRSVPLLERKSLYWLAVAATGVVVSAVGFATQWASENAFIPGLFFPAIFAPIAAADLVRRAGGSSRRRQFLSGAVALGLGGALAGQMMLQLYSPRPLIPDARDRRTGAELVDLLRDISGPVLMPYHPWYPVLAGKRPSYPQMGINDVTRAGYPFPQEIIERVLAQHYEAVILDNPPQGRYDFVLGTYKLGRYFRGDEVPRVAAGYSVRPTYLLVPKRPEPPPPNGRRVFDFESGTYRNWTVEGSAFGTHPAGGPFWEQGPVGPFEGSYLVNSFTGGDRSTGRMRSIEFVVDRPRLSYRVGGGRLPGEIAVRLLVEGRAVHEGTGSGSDIMEERFVDVRQHLGKKMAIELVDEARGPWGHLLFDDVVLRD